MLAGEWASQLARVREVSSDGIAQICLLNELLEIVDKDIIQDIPVHNVVREFRVGDSVIVRFGQNTGRSGVILNIECSVSSHGENSTAYLGWRFRQSVLVVQEFASVDEVSATLVVM